MPGIDLDTRNLVLNETKSLFSGSLHFSVCVGGGETDNKQTRIYCIHLALVLSAKRDRERRVGYYFK